MKNLLFLHNALQRSVLCFMLLTSAFAISFTSCSDDDEDIPQGGEIDFGVPPSVVDGVRPTEASGVKISYNEDGTIRNAEVDGCTFTFNYAATRAAGSRKLNSITADRSDGGSTESWKADNFVLLSNGFIGGYRLAYSMNDSRNDWWEKEENNYQFSYQDDGKIEKINMAVTASDAEEGPFSDSGSYSYTYDQNGGLRKIVGTSHGFTYFEQEYKYSSDFANKYNTMLLTLAPEDLISSDAVFRILAVTGFLGNASKKLPQKANLSYKDPEYPEDNETETWNLVYGISSNGVINWYSVNGQQYTCKFIDADHVEIQ